MRDNLKIIFLVEASMEYGECSHVIGVYSTKELADQAAKGYKDDDIEWYINIREIILDSKEQTMSKTDKKILAVIIIMSVGILAPYPFTSLVSAFVSVVLMDEL